MAILENIKRVLIIRCGALGDLVYSTSIMQALRSQYTEEITIDWVCTPGAGALFSQDPGVGKIFPLRHRRVPIFFSRQKRDIIAASKKEPYDLLINLESQGPIFDPLAKAVEATHKIGAPFTRPDPDIPAPHMVDIIKRLFAPIINPELLKNSYPKLYGTPWEKIASKYNLPDRYIILNPSNSHNKRQRLNYRAWPREQWKELIAMLPADLPLVIIAGKGEEAYFEPIRPFPENVIDLVGKSPLADLIGIIEHAQAIVTTDTGPAHMASAVDTPIFVLVGPTPPATWPYSTPHNPPTVISQNLPCSPCYNTPAMFACTDNRCMSEIAPETVRRAVETFLAKIN